VHTLPRKTSIRIRHPGRHLVDWLAATTNATTVRKIAVELTDWVERSTIRRWYRWYAFATGEHESVSEEYRPFEVEPGYALLASTVDDVTVYVEAFSDDADVLAALEVARDAVLEGRDTAAQRVVREVLVHGWPLYLTLLRKERNLLGR
jgi:hypothetical protein